MTTARSIKQTPKTFTIVFDNNSIEDEKRLKALAVLMGYYNPMRKEMKDENECYKLVQDIRAKGELDWILTQISRQLK